MYLQKHVLALLSSQGRGRGVALIECKLVNCYYFVAAAILVKWFKVIQLVLYRIQLITSLTILRQHSLVSIICICMYQPVSHRVSLARHFSIKGTSFANKPFLQGRLRLFLPFLMLVTHNECLWEVFFHSSSAIFFLTNWLCSLNTFLSLRNLLLHITYDN